MSISIKVTQKNLDECDQNSGQETSKNIEMSNFHKMTLQNVNFCVMYKQGNQKSC